MTPDMLTLGFDEIIRQLQSHAVSQAAKDLLAETAPILHEAVCRARMEETTAARAVLEGAGNPPLALMNDLEKKLTTAFQGGMLSPSELSEIAVFSATIRRMRQYLQNAAVFSAGISSWHTELPDLSVLEEAICNAIHEDHILDDASAALHDLRRRREHKEQAIREKLNQILSRHRSELSDDYITQRSGFYVAPVQRRYQHSFPGRVIDVSSKGNTVFMEPTAIHELQQELNVLMIDMDTEERRILWALSDTVASYEEVIRQAIHVMTELDVLFAKAKLSAAMHAVPAILSADRCIHLVEARHPLLNQNTCVPLNFSLYAPDQGVAITGPNTGGKTVCLKTVGLLCLMAQSGLHIPCSTGSVIGLMDGVYCDIGDSQSISQNLSTFSGHIKNIIRILSVCSRDSLVLLDEPGSGTDPAEGSGLATAILEDLLRRRCLFLVTTHDPQLKQWAEESEHIVTARMAFDQQSLLPLYSLELGVSGESCAIEIARRLGMWEDLLVRAKEVADHGYEAFTQSEGKNYHLHTNPSQLKRIRMQSKGEFEHFTRGDSVLLLPDKKNAIVFQPADELGNVVIQLQGKKITVRHNRLELLVPASELYPPDYDFSIIFDTVSNRKAAHLLSRKSDPDAVVVIREGTPEN